MGNCRVSLLKCYEKSWHGEVFDDKQSTEGKLSSFPSNSVGLSQDYGVFVKGFKYLFTMIISLISSIFAHFRFTHIKFHRNHSLSALFKIFCRNIILINTILLRRFAFHQYFDVKLIIQKHKYDIKFSITYWWMMNSNEYWYILLLTHVLNNIYVER